MRSLNGPDVQVASTQQEVLDPKCKLLQKQKDAPKLPDKRTWTSHKVMRTVFKELSSAGTFSLAAGVFHPTSLRQNVDAMLACAHAILRLQTLFITDETSKANSDEDTRIIGWSFDATPQDVSLQKASTVQLLQPDQPELEETVHRIGTRDVNVHQGRIVTKAIDEWIYATPSILADEFSATLLDDLFTRANRS